MHDLINQHNIFLTSWRLYSPSDYAMTIGFYFKAHGKDGGPSTSSGKDGDSSTRYETASASQTKVIPCFK